MLQRLEAMGYVTRTRGTADERMVFVRLTETGRQPREKARCLSHITLEASGLKWTNSASCGAASPTCGAT